MSGIGGKVSYMGGGWMNDTAAASSPFSSRKEEFDGNRVEKGKTE